MIFFKSIKYYIAGFFLIGLYILPYILLGENSFIRIHDNLDGELVVRILNTRFNGSFIPSLMNGLP